jgi:ankyrin repeat protein
VCQPDNKGSYPIHVAACNGKLKVVMILLRRCPNCAALRNTEGRTFLHVATSKKRYGIAKFVCRRPKFAFILNAQDKNGDTALHLAVQVGASSIFNCLFRNTEVCLDLSNKDGLTPHDLSWVVIPARFYNKKVLALFFLILESKSIHFFFDIVVQV